MSILKDFSSLPRLLKRLQLDNNLKPLVKKIKNPRETSNSLHPPLNKHTHTL